jgi:hypothetical protein
MQKDKESTLRMVAFLELGIDCAYTIEASLGGKSMTHFSAHDLMSFGTELCLSFLEIYPAMALSSSTLSPAPHLSQSTTRHREAGSFFEEIAAWRAYYNIESVQGLGVSLMTPFAVRELTPSAGQDVRDDGDSDNSAENTATARPIIRPLASKLIPRPPKYDPSKDNRSTHSSFARAPHTKCMENVYENNGVISNLIKSVDTIIRSEASSSHCTKPMTGDIILNKDPSIRTSSSAASSPRISSMHCSASHRRRKCSDASEMKAPGAEFTNIRWERHPTEDETSASSITMSQRSPRWPALPGLLITLQTFILLVINSFKQEGSPKLQVVVELRSLELQLLLAP